MSNHEQLPEMHIVPNTTPEKETPPFLPEINNSTLKEIENETKGDKRREKEIERIINERDNPKRIH